MPKVSVVGADISARECTIRRVRLAIFKHYNSTMGLISS